MATRICTGNGECLTQTTDMNTYGKYPDMTCSYNCEPMKCPNYLVCGAICPKWLFGCHRGTCVNCAVLNFGNLEFSEDECPTCLDTKTCLKLLNCSHKQCVDCFRRSWYGKERPDIPFPIPELEEEYYDTSEEDRWQQNQLVVDWQARCDIAYDLWESEHQREQNLRCCPLCRK